MTEGTAHVSAISVQTTSDRRAFPGWAWVAVGLAFPIAGYIGWAISGPVDAFGAALLGGTLTGAGLGTVQWWAGKGAFGPAATWISASAVSYAAGLAAGAALVGYGTDLADLVLMGVISGATIGAAQGLVLARQGSWRFGAAWGTAMPLLFGAGWAATTAIGVSVEDQFTVFGASGALVFMLLSGLVLARFTPSSTRVA
jgi:hypothetical protein